MLGLSTARIVVVAPLSGVLPPASPPRDEAAGAQLLDPAELGWFPAGTDVLAASGSLTPAAGTQCRGRPGAGPATVSPCCPA